MNSIDLHFLRHARRVVRRRASLDAAFGDRDHARAQRVQRRRRGDRGVRQGARPARRLPRRGRVFTLPLAEHDRAVAVPARRTAAGMYFVGEFPPRAQPGSGRVPGDEVLPLLDPGAAGPAPAHGRRQLARPGRRWTSTRRRPGVRLVGWVPSVQPYIERSRLSAVPLLHGAGVKRKVIQSMMAGTPVVTTPVGAEGLDLMQGEHALIAVRRDGPGGRHHPPAHRRRPVAPHGDRRGRARERPSRRGSRRAALRRDPRAGDGAPAARAARRRARRYRPTATQRSGQRIRRIGRPGETVLVVCGEDDGLLDAVRIRAGRSRRAATADRAGSDPVDGPAAANHLEAQRHAGARYFVLPKPGVLLAAALPGAHRMARRRGPAAAPGRAPRRVGPRAGPPRPSRPRPRSRRRGSWSAAPTPPTAPGRRRCSSPSSARAGC